MAVASPVTDDEGHLRGVFTIHVDLSERHELEEKLRHAQKLEAVGQLAGGVAHDFNNLLTAISGYAELAYIKAEGDPELQAEIEQISRAGDRAAALTRQLLAFSRKQVLTPKVIDLNALVIDVSAMLSRVIGSHITLTTTLSDGECPILADPTQIEQVLINLTVNARDAMPNGGTLSVETSTRTTGAGENIVLSVSDTGVGMDELTQSRIFEPFFTTKDVGKGTGLGLATVYGIVNQTSGTISVESTLGTGTTFEIVFPAATGVANTVAAERIAMHGDERVLLVEDQPAVLSLTARMLVEKGYTAVSAPEGSAAIDIASRERFDILVTDVVMPGLNGKELAQAVTALQPDIAVLFTSGYPDQDLESRDIVGAVSLLRKPYTAEALAGAVRKTLELRSPTLSPTHPA
jgi:nitrogen-specific signal transduction histidine kinase